MTTLARRERGSFADLLDWLEAEIPAFPVLPRPFTGAQMIRVEELDDAGQYVLRAELPGIDPDKDVDIAIEDGLLTVKAERREEKKEGGRSEFRYGSFTRTLRLPAGAAEDGVRATYHDGILEIRVPIAAESKPPAKHISVVKG
ncbi:MULTISPECIES: Hsp20/alpha crystallin family protein [unclassified Kribbella]|uniref:Hsp20/alpha crystallin family protein n=1 Tax=unclassified Kribbella TaxID=2644121 RepID=UPI003015B30A